MLPCKDDNEMLEIMLAIIADSAYPKIVNFLRKNGKKKDIIEMAWDLTLAEETGFVPVASYTSFNVPYEILFGKATGITAYVPLHSIEH